MLVFLESLYFLSLHPKSHFQCGFSYILHKSWFLHSRWIYLVPRKLSDDFSVGLRSKSWRHQSDGGMFLLATEETSPHRSFPGDDGRRKPVGRRLLDRVSLWLMDIRHQSRVRGNRCYLEQMHSGGREIWGHTIRASTRSAWLCFCVSRSRKWMSRSEQHPCFGPQGKVQKYDCSCAFMQWDLFNFSFI